MAIYFHMEYRSNHNIVYDCKYHVVWCPKYRRSVLTDSVDVRLKELIKETCEKLQIELIDSADIFLHRLHDQSFLLA